MRRVEEKGITGKFLCDIFRKRGLISDEEIEGILKIQQETGEDLQKIIVEQGILKENKMMEA